MLVVVALGGNAIVQRGERGTATEQRAALREAADELASLAAAGHRLVVTHGNGPQVGRLLIADEALGKRLPPMPLDVHVAETQGQLGYLIQQEMTAALRRAGVSSTALTLITQVVVDPADPAFARPTKPVGPHLNQAQAAELRARRVPVGSVSGGGWRRLVPSPDPIAIVEEDALRALLAAGLVPVAAGGGGIPVVREGDGFRGVAAVVDKDLTAALLVAAARADLLLVLTDVERVQRGFGTPRADPLDRISVAAARAAIASGEFPAGSMGPKLEAAARAVEAGARAVVAGLGHAADAIEGRSGTEVVA